MTKLLENLEKIWSKVYLAFFKARSEFFLQPKKIKIPPMTTENFSSPQRASRRFMTRNLFINDIIYRLSHTSKETDKPKSEFIEEKFKCAKNYWHQPVCFKQYRRCLISPMCFSKTFRDAFTAGEKKTDLPGNCRIDFFKKNHFCSQPIFF